VLDENEDKIDKFIDFSANVIDRGEEVIEVEIHTTMLKENPKLSCIGNYVKTYNTALNVMVSAGN